MTVQLRLRLLGVPRTLRGGSTDSWTEPTWSNGFSLWSKWLDLFPTIQAKVATPDDPVKSLVELSDIVGHMTPLVDSNE